MFSKVVIISINFWIVNFSNMVPNCKFIAATFANRGNHSHHEHIYHIDKVCLPNFTCCICTFTCRKLLNWNNKRGLVIKNLQIVVGPAIWALTTPDYLLSIWVLCFLYLSLAINSNQLMRWLKLPLMVPFRATICHRQQPKPTDLAECMLQHKPQTD